MLSLKVNNRQKRHARVRAKLKGTGNCPRLVVYRGVKNVYAQLVNDEKGVTLATASTLIKQKKGKAKAANVETAKKVGIEIAKLAQEKKVAECVFDRNGYKYHGQVKAVAEGAREGGLKF